MNSQAASNGYDMHHLEMSAERQDEVAEPFLSWRAHARLGTLMGLHILASFIYSSAIPPLQGIAWLASCLGSIGCHCASGMSRLWYLLQEEVDDAIAELEGMRKAAEADEAATVQLRKRLVGLQGTLRTTRCDLC